SIAAFEDCHVLAVSARSESSHRIPCRDIRSTVYCERKCRALVCDQGVAPRRRQKSSSIAPSEVSTIIWDERLVLPRARPRARDSPRDYTRGRLKGGFRMRKGAAFASGHGCI